MKIKKGFVIEKVADSYLACATGSLVKKFSGFVKLNSTGAFLWNLLAEGDKTSEDLIKNLTEEYDISIDIAKKDVSAFVSTLKENGILNEE